jgi:hypothetical protein
MSWITQSFESTDRKICLVAQCAMLFVISAIFLQAEFALAERTGVFANLFARLPEVGVIVAFELYKLVVEANYQPCGNPLGDEVAPFSPAGHLAEQRKRHGDNGNPEIRG